MNISNKYLVILIREIFITTPLDTFDEKIQENRKILSENSNREKENDILNKIKEQNNENKNIEEIEQTPTNLNEDELGVTTPFFLVEQKVLVKDEIYKKVDINLLSSTKNNNPIKIDKEIPLNYGELVNKSLKEKYLIWITLYKNLVEGILTSNITETQKQTIFFQLSLIDKELDLIGIGLHLQGRKYLHDAIYYLIVNGNNTTKISAAQYLTSKYKRSGSTISRDMQNAILHAWRISSVDDLIKYYTAKVNYETGVPTPTEFIYYYADKIKKNL